MAAAHPLLAPLCALPSVLISPSVLSPYQLQTDPIALSSSGAASGPAALPTVPWDGEQGKGWGYSGLVPAATADELRQMKFWE